MTQFRFGWWVPLWVMAGWLGCSAPARAAGRYGDVAFPNSGAALAQADFIEGMALLHDFEYPLAKAAFERAEAADPDFAMAYWGEAMTFNHPIWMQQSLDPAQAALRKLAGSAADRRTKAKTAREKAYLDAVEILYGEGDKFDRDFRYEDAMRKVHESYPEDVNAAAFYALAILGTAHAGRDTTTYMRAASLLEEAWIDHRDHPGVVHYLIHCYDDPAHAALGLRTARIYGRIAPEAPHALHMTSHIFLALGMWPETVDANVAAISAVNQRRRSDGKKPIHWGHYPLWLAYAYLQLGKTDEVSAMLGACRTDAEALAQSSPAKNTPDSDQSPVGSYANMRLRYLLDTGNWQSEAARWPIPETAGPRARLDFVFANALAQIGLGHGPEARTILGELETAARAVVEPITQQTDPDPTERTWPEIFVLQTRGLLAELEGDLAAAEKLLTQAAGLEEALPIAFGPPSIDKPSNELLGQFLFRHGRTREANAQFEKALARAPGRRVALQGLAATSVASSPSRTTRSSRREEKVAAVPENDPICGLPARH